MRANGWEEELERVLLRHERMNFADGVHDCAALARDVVCAIAPHLAPRIAEVEAAARRNRRPASLFRLVWNVEHALGRARRIPVGLAQRGDVAVVRMRDLCALGIVYHSMIVGPNRYGLCRVPLLYAVRAYRID